MIGDPIAEAVAATRALSFGLMYLATASCASDIFRLFCKLH